MDKQNRAIESSIKWRDAYMDAEQKLAECQQRKEQIERLLEQLKNMLGMKWGERLTDSIDNLIQRAEAAEQERDRLLERLEIIRRGLIEKGWPPQFIEQVLGGESEHGNQPG